MPRGGVRASTIPAAQTAVTKEEGMSWNPLRLMSPFEAGGNKSVGQCQNFADHAVKEMSTQMLNSACLISVNNGLPLMQVPILVLTQTVIIHVSEPALFCAMQQQLHISIPVLSSQMPSWL